MPKVAELIKLFEYGNAETKKSEQPISSFLVEQPEEQPSEEKTLKDSISSIRTKLRAVIREREESQRDMKYIIQNRGDRDNGDYTRLSKIGRRYMINSMLANAKELSSLYLIMRFFRQGLECPDAEFAENEFNRIFRKNQAFRNEFWTCWNAKFQS